MRKADSSRHGTVQAPLWDHRADYRAGLIDRPKSAKAWDRRRSVNHLRNRRSQVRILSGAFPHGCAPSREAGSRARAGDSECLESTLVESLAEQARVRRRLPAQPRTRSRARAAALRLIDAARRGSRAGRRERTSLPSLGAARAARIDRREIQAPPGLATPSPSWFATTVRSGVPCAAGLLCGANPLAGAGSCLLKARRS
jgi:hypothetical protein